MSEGEHAGAVGVPCHHCGGHGETPRFDGLAYTPCSECAGTGVLIMSTAGECEGTPLTARPEGHWVLAGKEWINMALVYSVEPGTKWENEGGIDLYISGADCGMLPIEQANADGVLAYLSAHAYQA